MKNSIIIIEDDKKINDLICNLLKSEYTIYQSFDGKDGLSLIFANNIDVIILDLGLPDMDGMEVIDKIIISPSIKCFNYIRFKAPS